MHIDQKEWTLISSWKPFIASGVATVIVTSLLLLSFYVAPGEPTSDLSFYISLFFALIWVSVSSFKIADYKYTARKNFLQSINHLLNSEKERNKLTIILRNGRHPNSEKVLSVLWISLGLYAGYAWFPAFIKAFGATSFLSELPLHLVILYVSVTSAYGIVQSFRAFRSIWRFLKSDILWNIHAIDKSFGLSSLSSFGMYIVRAISSGALLVPIIFWTVLESYANQSIVTKIFLLFLVFLQVIIPIILILILQYILKIRIVRKKRYFSDLNLIALSSAEARLSKNKTQKNYLRWKKLIEERKIIADLRSKVIDFETILLGIFKTMIVPSAILSVQLYFMVFSNS